MAAPVRQHHLHHAAAHDRSGRRCTNSRRYGAGDARVGRESLIQSRSVHTTNPVRSGAPESAGTPSAPIARRGRTRAGTAANRVIASRVAPAATALPAEVLRTIPLTMMQPESSDASAVRVRLISLR